MAVTAAEIQVTWPTASNTGSVTTGSNLTSEAATIDAATVLLGLVVKAFHNATPGAGDYVDWWVLYECGDPDGASTEEYQTVGHAHYFGRTDCETDDPAILYGTIPAAADTFKLYVVNNAGETITVSACATEKKA